MERRARTHFKPYWVGIKPSFVQASSSTSLRCVEGVTLTVARRAFEAITTTCDIAEGSVAEKAEAVRRTIGSDE